MTFGRLVVVALIVLAFMVLGSSGQAQASFITVALFQDGANPYGGSNTQILTSTTGTYTFTFPNTSIFSGTFPNPGISGRVVTNDNSGSTVSGFEELRYDAQHNGTASNTLSIIATDANFSGTSMPYQTTLELFGSAVATSGTVTFSNSLTGTFDGGTTTAGTITCNATGPGAASCPGSFGSASPPTFTGSTPYRLIASTSTTTAVNGEANTADSELLTQVAQVSAVPEPGSIALLGTGLAGVLLTRKRIISR